MRCRLVFGVLAAMFFNAAQPSLAQSGQLEQELRQHILDQYDAWNRADLASIDLSWIRGFGFRTENARTPGNVSEDQARERLGRFFERMERYRIEMGELNIEIVSDIGLVSGSHIEDFQVKGRPPERIRVRRSATYRRTSDGKWEALLFHRDAQRFNDRGRYIPRHLSED